MLIFMLIFTKHLLTYLFLDDKECLSAQHELAVTISPVGLRVQYSLHKRKCDSAVLCSRSVKPDKFKILTTFVETENLQVRHIIFLFFFCIKMILIYLFLAIWLESFTYLQ